MAFRVTWSMLLRGDGCAVEKQLGKSCFPPSPETALSVPPPPHTHLRVKCVLPFEGGSCHELPSAQSSGTEAGLIPGAPPVEPEGGWR